MTYWEEYLKKVNITQNTKEHLLEKLSIITKIYNFLYLSTDSIYVSYLMDNIVSISKKIDLPTENFFVNLLEWNSLFVDRETADLIIGEYLKKEKYEFCIDSLKSYLSYRDRYFISLSYFPFIEQITKSDLLNIIETLLVSIENTLIDNYSNQF